MIPYIGDISKRDAEALKSHAELSEGIILEFGCGASTQIIAKYKNPRSRFISIDTSMEWINKTKRNLDLLEIDKRNVELYEYHTFMNGTMPMLTYTTVFNDGVDNLRLDFGTRIWPFIKVGTGMLMFHDTRRPHDARNALDIAALYHNEITGINMNISESNITILYKKEKEPYDNWQISEHKLPWQIGYGEPDINYIKAHLNE